MTKEVTNSVVVVVVVVVFYDSIIIHLGCQVELSKSILRALCINQFDASSRREDMVSITNKKRSQRKDEIQQTLLFTKLSS